MFFVFLQRDQCYSLSESWPSDAAYVDQVKMSLLFCTFIHVRFVTGRPNNSKKKKTPQHVIIHPLQFQPYKKNEQLLPKVDRAGKKKKRQLPQHSGGYRYLIIACRPHSLPILAVETGWMNASPKAAPDRLVLHL